MKERIIYILELVVARVATTCFVTRSIKIIHSQSCEGLKIVAQCNYVNSPGQNDHVHAYMLP